MSRTSGPNDLLLAVDRAADLPLRDQIAEQLREAIRSRRLRPGVVLPAGRTLAADLGVSRGVVVEAYEELREQGFVEMRPRSAPRVREGADSPLPAGPDGAPPPRYDLVPELPDLGLFPRRAWSQALQLALRTAPDRAFDYGDPRGDERLRRVLADYLGRARGVVADPEQIVVCQGSIQAVDLACRVVASLGGRSIGLEDPCADGLRRAAPGAGLSFIPIPVDARGAEVERLVASSADAAIVTPAHQFPSGVTMTAARRKRLLAWARSGGVVIEDDYDAEFFYDGRPAGALQGEAPDSIVYVGSASKTLAPAIRLGWAVMPRRLADRAAELKAALDGGSPAPEQIALAHMIETAAFERHVRRTRVEYGRRRQALLGALAAAMPRARIAGERAGLHLAARLPASVDRAGLEQAALAARIRMFMLESFMHDPPAFGSSLLIGYGRLPAAAAEPAVAALADVLGPVSQGGRGTVAGLPRSGSVAACPPPSRAAVSG